MQFKKNKKNIKTDLLPLRIKHVNFLCQYLYLVNTSEFGAYTKNWYYQIRRLACDFALYSTGTLDRTRR